VRKVNYSVEAARLGQMTDYEKVDDRSVDQRGHHAAGFHRLGCQARQGPHEHLSSTLKSPWRPWKRRKTSPTIRGLEHLDRSVEELELSVRSYKCLKNANIQTIRELVQKSENEMLKTKNFGRKSLNEIKDILVKMGLALGMKFDEHGRIIWPPLPSPDRGTRHQKKTSDCKGQYKRCDILILVQNSESKPAHRRAVLRSLVTNLFEHGRITHHADALPRRRDPGGGKNDHSRQARHPAVAPHGGFLHHAA